MDSQEAHSSSRARVKVDFMQQPTVTDKERKWNHRKSMAWDSAFLTNPGVLDPEELFGNLKIEEDETEVKHNKYSSKPRPCVSFPRPSFAWDNAFLTAPGVLDAEELSLVNNGFTSNTQFPKSDADSMITPRTQGNRFSVSSIESDLFRDLRASSVRSSTPNVKQTVTRKIQPKLPDAKKRIKGSNKKDQHLSLIPQPKVMSSSFSSAFISKPSTTPTQAKPQKKCVASEIGMIRGKQKNLGFGEQSGSKSITRSSNSRSAMKDLTSSFSGLRLPRPKMGFFDSENGEKENREPNVPQATVANRGRRNKFKLETSSTPENRSVLGQRKTRNWQ